MKSIFGLVVVLLAVTGVNSYSLDYDQIDGFRNKIEGVTETGQACDVHYLVDVYSTHSAVAISWYFPSEEEMPLSVQMRFRAEVFEDIFVTGKAFEADYQLPEVYGNEMSLATTPEGMKVINYKKVEEFRGATISSEAQIVMSADLEPVQFTSNYEELKPGPFNDVELSGVCRF